VNIGAEYETDVTVEGTTTTNALVVPGPANVQGLSTLADTTISGTTTLNGTTNLNGTTTLNGPLTANGGAVFQGGVQIWGANPNSGTKPSHFDAGGGRLYMGWMPGLDEAHITFKLSDDSGMLGYSGSSRKIKDDIQNFTDDFHKILKAQPVSFVMKGSENSPRSAGYIAEDFHDIGLSSLLIYNKSGEPMVIKYDRVALYLLEVVKELIRDVESLKEKVNAGPK
jgi:hypothetical protein